MRCSSSSTCTRCSSARSRLRRSSSSSCGDVVIEIAFSWEQVKSVIVLRDGGKTTVTIGRAAQNDVTIVHEHVSQRHLVLQLNAVGKHAVAICVLDVSNNGTDRRSVSAGANSEEADGRHRSMDSTACILSDHRTARRSLCLLKRMQEEESKSKQGQGEGRFVVRTEHLAVLAEASVHSSQCCTRSLDQPLMVACPPMVWWLLCLSNIPRRRGKCPLRSDWQWRTEQPTTLEDESSHGDESGASESSESSQEAEGADVLFEGDDE
eukprot:3459982-Amphidinium_carterae.1